MSRLLIFLCITNAFYVEINAQKNYQYASSRVLHFTDENGLPQNSAKGLVFDEMGYLWVATESGMVIYDGSQFIPIRGIDPSLKVDYIFQDFDGNIYFCDAKTNILKKTKGSHNLSKINGNQRSSYEYLLPSKVHNKDALFNAIIKLNLLSHAMGQDNKIIMDGKNDIKFVQNDLEMEGKYNYFVFNDYILKLYKNKVIYARHKNEKEWKYITQSGIHLNINLGYQYNSEVLVFSGGDHIFISGNHKIYRLTFDGKNIHAEIYIDYIPFDHVKDKIFVADYDKIHDVFAFGSQNKGLYIVTGTNFKTASIEKSNNNKFLE